MARRRTRSGAAGVVRPAAVVALAVLAPLLAVVVGHGARAEAVAAQDLGLAAAEARVVALHDRARAEVGLPPLVVLPVLADTARDWSRTMAATGVVQHQSEAAGYPSYATTSCDPTGLAWTWCAENVAAGQPDADGVHAAWMGSTGHRANVLRPEATAVGVGAWRGADGRIHWTARYLAAPLPTADQVADAHLLAWIDEVHVAFADRPPTAAERDRWYGVARSAGRGAVVDAMATSDAWLGAEIDEVYAMALDRRPDAEGRAYWTRVVRAGTRITALGTYVLASDERWAASGGRASTWVDDLHRRVLGRPATGAELADAGRRLAAGASRSEVARGVLDSRESRLARVEALYLDVLGRPADDGGRSYWATELLAHDDVRLAAFLAGSDEVWERARP